MGQCEPWRCRRRRNPAAASRPWWADVDHATPPPECSSINGTAATVNVGGAHVEQKGVREVGRVLSSVLGMKIAANVVDDDVELPESSDGLTSCAVTRDGPDRRQRCGRGGRQRRICSATASSSDDVRSDEDIRAGLGEQCDGTPRPRPPFDDGWPCRQDRFYIRIMAPSFPAVGKR